MSEDTDALVVLGNPARLLVFRHLARHAPEGLTPAEICEALSIPPNTLGVHIAHLSRAGLVRRLLSGKSVRYSIDLVKVGALMDFLANECCGGRPELCASRSPRMLERLTSAAVFPATRIFNVLFICSGNSARSIMAEAILNREGAKKFRAFSAGTRAPTAPNPRAIAVLKQHGYDVGSLRSKHVEEFQRLEAPKMDFIFTVCDRTANEHCPAWTGQPISAHWGLPDPANVDGTEAEKGLAFLTAYRTLKHRVAGFLALPVESLDRASLQRNLEGIGREAGSAGKARPDHD